LAAVWGEIVGGFGWGKTPSPKKMPGINTDTRKSLILNHLTCIWCPRSNYAEIFGMRKLESLG